MNNKIKVREEKELINLPDNPMSDEQENVEEEFNPPQLQQPIEMPGSSLEQVKVGDIFLGSCQLNAEQLTHIVYGMLKEKTIKSYLENLKEKRTRAGGSYFG